MRLASIYNNLIQVVPNVKPAEMTWHWINEDEKTIQLTFHNIPTIHLLQRRPTFSCKPTPPLSVRPLRSSRSSEQRHVATYSLVTVTRAASWRLINNDRVAAFGLSLPSPNGQQFPFGWPQRSISNSIPMGTETSQQRDHKKPKILLANQLRFDYQMGCDITVDGVVEGSVRTSLKERES